MHTIRFILAALALALSQFAGAAEPLQMNAELHALYLADQADRKGDAIDWALVGPRDLARQQRVRELAKAGALKHSGDYLHAAMVFQHGGEAHFYRQANLWALRAVELDPTNKSARWLACASEDRWLHRTGKPQIWGTQYQKPAPDGSPQWSMEPFDRTAKTDAERVAMGVKTLADSAARLAEMNKKQSGK